MVSASDGLFYSLDMPSAQSLYFAAQLEIPLYFVIVEDSETVNHGDSIAGPFDYIIGVKVKIWRMRDSQY